MGTPVKKYKNPNENPKVIQGNAIKRRLAEHYMKLHNEEGLSTYTLRKQLYAETQIDFTENTISATITEGSDPAPNMFVVIGLCRLWGLDYASVLAPPETEVRVAPSITALMPKSEVLTDEGYMGTYFGYMYTKNLNRKEIYNFTLRIEPKNGSTQAIMETVSHPDNVDGDEITFSRSFIGTPIVMNKSQNIYIMLSDYQGDFYTLFFDYRHYNTEDGMYFRKGICITSESSSDKLLLENFVLFKREVSQAKARKYIPGLLKLNDDTFEVTEEDLDTLLKDEKFALAYSKYAYLFEGQQRMSYQFKTSQFITAIKDRYDQDEVNQAMQVILTLKSKAREPDRMEYANPSGLPGFAKTFLQRQSHTV